MARLFPGKRFLVGLAADVAAVNEIAAVPTILEAVCRMTGTGFAANLSDATLSVPCAHRS